MRHQSPVPQKTPTALGIVGRLSGRVAAVLLATCLATLLGQRAHAQSDGAANQSIWQQDTLTGDWGGERTALKTQGIDVTLNDISEILGDVSGGINRGSVYEGRFEFTLDADLQKLLGWTGATAHTTIYQINNIGGRIDPDFVGSISDPSNIDALPTARLFTAWLQQTFLDDKISLRIGQLAVDDEFLTSKTAGGLIDGTFGWPDLMAANLPGGGPAYPLATPGVRVAVKPSDALTIRAAAFSGNPAGAGCNGDPQACDLYGTKFSFSGGVFSIAELQYDINQGKSSQGLPGTYKVGAWYHSADFADEHYGLNAGGLPVSLASPAVVAPLAHMGNWGLYGVVDQTTWRAASGPGSISAFLRAGAAPSDRNLVSFYVDGGLGVTAPLPHRDNDILTIGASWSNVSSDAAALDVDTQGVLGAWYPVRDYELVLEASYQIQVAPWWVIQPDVQYIVHPGGNVIDPAFLAPIPNAFVLGARTTVSF